MSIPDYQTLMLPVLRAAADGETRVPEAEEKIAQEFQLSWEEREQLLPSGKQRLLHNRIHWAKFYLQKAGLIESPKRGRFVISQAGRELLARGPKRIDNDALMEYPSFRDFRTAQPSTETGDEVAGSPILTTTTATPEESIEAAYGSLQATLRGEILGRIQQNSPSFFERVIVNLLVAMDMAGHTKTLHPSSASPVMEALTGSSTRIDWDWIACTFKPSGTPRQIQSAARKSRHLSAVSLGSAPAKAYL